MAVVDIETRAESIRGPRNCFEITISFSFGDADNDKKVVIYYPKDMKAELIDMINFYQETSQREWVKAPEKHPMYHLFFRDESNGAYWNDEPDEHGEYYKFKTAMLDYWPCDIDGWGVAKFDGIAVRYINKLGYIHQVDFIEG